MKKWRAKNFNQNGIHPFFSSSVLVSKDRRAGLGATQRQDDHHRRICRRRPRRANRLYQNGYRGSRTVCIKPGGQHCEKLQANVSISTYRGSDDREIVPLIIHSIRPDCVIEMKKKKLFAY
jgi:hypothetical protein